MKTLLMTCPSRLDRLEENLKYLPADTVVYCDHDERGPAYNLEKMFRDFDGKEEILVVQDDTEIAPWFMEEVEKSKIDGQLMTYANNSSKPVKFYHRGFSYAWIHESWGQANLFPLWFISDYLEWTKILPPLPEKFIRNPSFGTFGPEDFSYRKSGIDDVCVTACLLWLRKKALLTLPNLIQHRVDQPSTLRDKVPESWKSRLYGKDLLRPWGKEKIVDLPPMWRLRPFVHPSRVEECIAKGIYLDRPG